MSERIKISWVTENFVDVDYPIIVELSKRFDISWHISYRKTVSYFDHEELEKLPLPAGVIKHIHINAVRMRAPRSFVYYGRLIKKIKDERADIIYLNLMGMPYFFPLADIMLDKNKVVYAAHDVKDHVGKKWGWLMAFYRKIIFRKFNNFHIFSKAQEKLLNELYPKKKYFISRLYLKDYGVYRGRETKEIEMPINFLFFGEIRYNKGIIFLIEAANRLAILYKNKFIVTIAGKCAEWKEYEELTHGEWFDLQIGFVQNQHIPKLFANAHYIVLPYIDITQSGVLMVACQYNVPAIASKLEEFENDITSGTNGYLFDPGSTDELFNIMESIIKNNNSDYKRLRKNLSDYVDREIAIDKIADRYAIFFSGMKNQ
jgi:glycosyltransferase involved in cell wall biosynthesis